MTAGDVFASCIGWPCNLAVLLIPEDGPAEPGWVWLPGMQGYMCPACAERDRQNHVGTEGMGV